MYPFGRKPLSQIDGNDIISLIALQVEENQYVDYKFDFNRKGNRLDLLELRKDVTSFANADGGVLVVGIPEDNKLPCHPPQGRKFGSALFEGKSSEQIEKEVQNALAVDITPELPNFEARAIPVPNEPDRHFVLVVAYGRSWRAPHFYRGTRSDAHLFFYKRYGSDNKPMEYAEMSESFRAKEKQEAVVRSFRDKCLQALDSGWTPIKFPKGAYVLHMFPGRLEPGSNTLDLKPIKESAGELDRLGLSTWSQYQSGFSPWFDFRGLAVEFRGSYEEPPIGYIRLFREGVLELLDVSYFLHSGPPTPKELCEEILKSVHRGWDFLESLNLPTPFEVGFTIWNHEGKFSAMSVLINNGAHVYPMVRIQSRESIVEDLEYLLDHVAQTHRVSGARTSSFVAPRKLAFSWHGHYHR